VIAENTRYGPPAKKPVVGWELKSPCPRNIGGTPGERDKRHKGEKSKGRLRQKKLAQKPQESGGMELPGVKKEFKR